MIMILVVVSLAFSQELVKIVADARVGGMLSGKAGIAHFHTGAASSLLDPLWEVINVSKGAIPITQMIPTHTSSRGPALLEVCHSKPFTPFHDFGVVECLCLELPFLDLESPVLEMFRQLKLG